MKVKLFLLYFVLFGILGYFREFFFVHINRIMYMKYKNEDVYALDHEQMPAVMRPFNTLSYDHLYYSKYFFTLLSLGFFYGLSHMALRHLTGNKNLVRYLNRIYLLLAGMAAISMTYGYLINERLQDDEYTLSRWLLGVAQSPLICLILIASSSLYKSTLSHNKPNV